MLISSRGPSLVAPTRGMPSRAVTSKTVPIDVVVEPFLNGDKSPHGDACTPRYVALPPVNESALGGDLLPKDGDGFNGPG